MSRQITLYVENPVVLYADERDKNAGFQLFDESTISLDDVVGKILQLVTGKTDVHWRTGEKLPTMQITLFIPDKDNED